MVKLYGVVGANYGDEGKGMVSARIRRHAGDPHRTVTVLTNGGAQRGHTVDADGRRKVFRHLGASMPGDASVTFCPPGFAVNPMVLMQDIRGMLGWCDGSPVVYVHPDCFITTPYDMMADQVSELAKGDARWGSTGMGVWHTRHRSSFMRLSAADMAQWFLAGDWESAEKRLLAIRDYWLKNKCGVCNIPAEYQQLFDTKGLLDHWLADAAEAFAYHVEVTDDPRRHGDYGVFVFENAQGLLLSAEHGKHATSSITGAKIIENLAQRMGLGDPARVSLHYVTRTYMTRHGTGPLPLECPVELLRPGMKDETNVWNRWQGDMRYGVLDDVSLYRRVSDDIQFADMDPTRAVVVVTHTDEVPFRRSGRPPLKVVESQRPDMRELEQSIG